MLSVVISWLEIPILRLQYFLFDETEYSHAYNNSNSIIEYIGGKIPNAGIWIQFTGKLHGDEDIDDVRQ